MATIIVIDKSTELKTNEDAVAEGVVVVLGFAVGVTVAVATGVSFGVGVGFEVGVGVGFGVTTVEAVTVAATD